MTLIIPVLREGQSQGERELMSPWTNGGKEKIPRVCVYILSVQKHAAYILAPPGASTVLSCQVLVDLAEKRDPYYEVQEKESD